MLVRGSCSPGLPTRICTSPERLGTATNTRLATKRCGPCSTRSAYLLDWTTTTGVSCFERAGPQGAGGERDCRRHRLASFLTAMPAMGRQQPEGGAGAGLDARNMATEVAI